jgi:hypothetical protein
VKFPGGLLANPLDFARLLMLIMHDGKEAGGERQVIPLSDIHEVIHPTYHIGSTLRSCPLSHICGIGEQCVAGRCIKPMGGGSNWYGLGVYMKPRLVTDGYPSELFHRGGHDGFTSYFNIDRELRNGVLIFINGSGKANRDKLRTAIVDAFMDHYRS